MAVDALEGYASKGNVDRKCRWMPLRRNTLFPKCSTAEDRTASASIAIEEDKESCGIQTTSN